MPSTQILLVLIVVGVLLWLVNSFIPMRGSLWTALDSSVWSCTTSLDVEPSLISTCTTLEFPLIIRHEQY